MKWSRSILLKLRRLRCKHGIGGIVLDQSKSVAVGPVELDGYTMDWGAGVTPSFKQNRRCLLCGSQFEMKFIYPRRVVEHMLKWRIPPLDGGVNWPIFP